MTFHTSTYAQRYVFTGVQGLNSSHLRNVFFMKAEDPCINFSSCLDFDKFVSHQGTHLVSVFSAWRIVMHSGQTQSSVGAASSWIQRKWYTRGHVSQLITTPSLWHNQQNRSAEATAAATGDSCWEKEPNTEILHRWVWPQSSVCTTFQDLNKDNHYWQPSKHPLHTNNSEETRIKSSQDLFLSCDIYSSGYTEDAP
jgi:hypothetical protein